MRRFFKTAIAVLALTGAFFALSACGNKVADVSVATSPQLVFVQGNPLDLSLGTLSVTDKETTKEIAMDAKGVQVSGYNPNQLGTQELTISYEGKSTKLNVEVVPRMKIENAVTDYLVGEKFDTSKGRIRFYKDDGTQSTVQLNNSAVTIKDFDSSTATAPLEITISYKTGTSEYTQPMDVNIYDVSTTDFKAPNKISYKSHDDGIDLKGGLITLYSPKREVTRYVQMESVEVSGFDLSAATMENMKDNALKQEVTLTYGAFEFPYEIFITYTDVSLVKDLAKDLMELDWSQGEFPEISEELGENALLAAQTYLNLSAGDKLEITSEEQVYIALAATAYGYDQWTAEVAKYADVFTLENGFDFVNEATYDEVKAAYDALSADPDSPLFTTAATLVGLANTFSETTLKEDGTTIGSYLENVYDPAGFAEEKVLARMKYMTELFAAIPETCAVDTISANKTAIAEALTIIKDGGFNTYEYRGDHDLLNSWRHDKDFFDILYTYLYQENKLDNELATLQNIGLPGLTEELYQADLSAYFQMMYLQYQYANETTWFMVYYNRMLDLEEQIKEDPMSLKIYENAEFDGFNTDGSTVSFKDLHNTMLMNGYYGNFYPIYGNDKLMAHWDKYMAVMNGYLDVDEDARDDYYASSEFQTAVKDLFDEFAAMLPSEQMAFLTALSPVAVEYGVSILELGQKEDGTYAAYNYYRMFWMNYSEEVLKDETLIGMFDNLVSAIECYAFAPHIEAPENKSSLQYFFDKMQAVIDSYTALEDGSDEKALFDSLFGTVYTDYKALYTKLTAEEQEPTELGDYADEFETIKEALTIAGTAASIMSTFQQYSSQLYAYNIILGAYESARAAAAAILSSGNDAIINAYYYEAYDMYGDGSYYTADIAYEDIRSYAMNILLAFDIYEDYEEKAPKAFLIKAAPQMLDFAEFVLASNLEQAASMKTKPADAKQLMADFRALTADEQYWFLALDMNILYHYSIMYTFVDLFASEDAANALMMLTNLEFYYCYYYTQDPDGYMDEAKQYKTTDEMQETIDTFYTHYWALSEEEKAIFDQWLGDMIEYYVEKYEAAGITIPTQDNADEGAAA